MGCRIIYLLSLFTLQKIGKYPGLSEKIDDAIAASIGSRNVGDGFEPVQLDETKKQTLAQTLRGVARAVER